jgi:dihydrofolate reductase
MINLIVATSKNGTIGKNNKIPWDIPEDLRYFKNRTLGSSIIMGRKTFESIGKPLPKRENIVITSNKNYRKKGVIVVDSLEKAIKKSSHLNEIFIIGGERVYEEALNLEVVERIYQTKIHKEIPGDRFFYLPKDFKLVSKEDKTNENYDFSYLVLEKNG